MPRTSHLTTNFTAGELSPRLKGRTELPRYANAADELQNVQVMVEGGAKRRPGMLYVASAKNANKACRLIPFVYSTTEAYVLEVGDLYMRFYKDGARLGAPYEIATTITEAMLFDLDFCQAADTMFLTHESMVPKRLRRFGDTNWVLDDIPFDPAPFDEIGYSFATTLTLSAATVGTGRTATAGSGVFLNGDVGREIVFRGGVFKITSFTSSTVVVGDVTSAFESASLASSTWTLAGSPQAAITPGAKDPIETTTTLTSAVLNVWRSTDVGKFVRMNGGLLKIESYSSGTVVNATIKQVLSSTTAAPANAWSLEAPVWDSVNGYPKACALFQQRLCLAGTAAFPQTIWGSSVGSYVDFTLGTADSDAFGFTLNSGQDRSIIQRMMGTRVLHALTYGGEHTLAGGVERPITPTNVQAAHQTAYGSSMVKPVRIGKDIVFAQRAGLKLRGIIYDASEDDFDADDLTQLAAHITGAGIVDLAYQQEPDPLAYAVRSDGVLALMTYSRRAEVLAWSRAVTEGEVESVACIPVADGDEVWVLVARTVGGSTVRYVERLSSTTKLDSSVVATTGSPAATWSGLDHLEGETVQCVADGSYMGEFTVVSGDITLPRTASSVDIGLGYSWRIKMLTPESGSGFGSAQGQAMSTSEVHVRLLDTYACDVNGDELAFRQFGSELLDEPPAAFTGLKRIETLGWERGESDLVLSSDLPFDAHVLAVIRTLTVNAG